jgi:hypothetical protein
MAKCVDSPLKLLFAMPVFLKAKVSLVEKFLRKSIASILERTSKLRPQVSTARQVRHQIDGDQCAPRPAQ